MTSNEVTITATNDLNAESMTQMVVYMNILASVLPLTYIASPTYLEDSLVWTVRESFRFLMKGVGLFDNEKFRAGYFGYGDFGIFAELIGCVRALTPDHRNELKSDQENQAYISVTVTDWLIYWNMFTPSNNQTSASGELKREQMDNVLNDYKFTWAVQYLTPIVRRLFDEKHGMDRLVYMFRMCAKACIGSIMTEIVINLMRLIITGLIIRMQSRYSKNGLIAMLGEKKAYAVIFVRSLGVLGVWFFGLLIHIPFVCLVCKGFKYMSWGNVFWSVICICPQWVLMYYFFPLKEFYKWIDPGAPVRLGNGDAYSASPPANGIEPPVTTRKTSAGNPTRSARYKSPSRIAGLEARLRVVRAERSAL